MLFYTGISRPSIHTNEGISHTLHQFGYPNVFTMLILVFFGGINIHIKSLLLVKSDLTFKQN